MSETFPITEFDMLTLNQSIHMFKALIPFLDYSLQKALSFYIRTQELMQTIQFYNHPENILNFSVCNSGSGYRPIHSVNDIFENERLIDELLKYCPKQYAYAISTFRQFSKMSDLFNIMNGGDFDFGQMPFNADMFSSMMGGSKSGNSECKEDNKHDSTPKNSGQNNSPPFDSPIFKSIFKPEQQKMYDEYIKQLDKLDFLNNPNP